MPRLNRLEIIGHLGGDPSMRYTPTGKAVTNLRVAVNNGRKQPDGSWSDETLWVNVDVWDEAAERAAEQLRKGNLVYAEGQLEVREYETRDGRAGFAVEMKFARIQSLERQPRDESDAPAEPPIAQARPREAEQPQPVAAGVASATEQVTVDDISF